MGATVTMALVAATPYTLIYSATHAGGAGAATANLDSAGAATPDLETDSVGTKLQALLDAGVTYAAQANARAFAFGRGDIEVTLQSTTVPDGGAQWSVDADITGPGPAPLRFTIGAAVDGVAYLRISLKRHP